MKRKRRLDEAGPHQLCNSLAENGIHCTRCRIANELLAIQRQINKNKVALKSYLDVGSVKKGNIDCFCNV